MVPDSLIFYVSAIIAAVLLFAINRAPAATLPCQLQPTQHRHCVCIAHGPQGGCRRWRCRRQYERA